MDWDERVGWKAVGDGKLQLVHGSALTRTLLVKFRIVLLGEISNALRGLPLSIACVKFKKKNSAFAVRCCRSRS